MTSHRHPLLRLDPVRSASPAPRPGSGKRRAVGAFRDAGQALDPGARVAMEQRFGHDLGAVRIHADADAALSARALGAQAYALGDHIGFAQGRYDAWSGAGRELLAHELAHVVQQTGEGTTGGGRSVETLEAEADTAASAVSRGEAAPPLSAAGPSLLRRVELRNVGRGEQSGFGRRGEFIDRLNTISTRLIFSVGAGDALEYTENPYGDETEFDRKMKSFIDDPATLPMRLTNRHGLLQSTGAGAFDAGVDGDSWATGYVDIDDMLGSDDLGFQVVLVHFLTERQRTHLYARRIGSTLNSMPEFLRAHNAGNQAEVELLRDFFSDPSIRLLQDGGTGDVFRRYRNARGDTIRARSPPAPRGQSGLNINLMDVRLRDGTIMSVQDYRDLLARERAALNPPARNGPGAFPRAVGPPP